jgi:hypothetical protein
MADDVWTRGKALSATVAEKAGEQAEAAGCKGVWRERRGPNGMRPENLEAMRNRSWAGGTEKNRDNNLGGVVEAATG